MKHLKRREFLKYATLTLTAGVVSTKQIFANLKPRGNFGGIQFGVITYSFRSMPSSIDDIISYCHTAGISAIELMGDPAEIFAGAPENPVKKWGGLTDEEKVLREAYQKKMATWRATASMKFFQKLRKKLKKAGIEVYAFKPNALREDSTDAEIAYAMRAAKALGATSVTVELTENASHTARLGKIAEQNKMYVGYHAHLQANDTLWDEAMAQSPYNSINLDCGHYIAAGGQNTTASLLQFIRKHHQRITSMHLKDRTTPANGAKNVVWGTGDTPICEILQLIRDEQYAIPVSVELEYEIPVGSDAVAEVKKCAAYAQKCLT